MEISFMALYEVIYKNPGVLYNFMQFSFSYAAIKSVFKCKVNTKR